MKDIGLLALLFGSIFTSNILLTNYLGMCSFLAVSREFKSSLGLGTAVTIVMAVTSVLNWMVYYWVLVPLGVEYLSFIVFIIVIAAFTQIVEMVIERVSEPLYAALGVFLPLITVNCAIFGACLFMVIRGYGLLASFVYGLGSGLGWAMAILIMAGIRRKMAARAVAPQGLEGAGITLIVAGTMALAFMGFNGMLNLN